MKDSTDTREAKLGAVVRYKPCESGDWGAVLVMAGVHKGKIGYYDDDTAGRAQKAIVYFGVFAPNTPHANIDLDNLARLPDDFCSFLTGDAPSAVAFSMLGVKQNVALTDDVCRDDEGETT